MLLNPYRFAPGASGGITVTYHNRQFQTTVSTTRGVDISGASTGDLMIVMFAIRATVGGVIASRAGRTSLLNTAQSDNVRVRIFYRIKESGDASTQTFTGDVSANIDTEYFIQSGTFDAATPPEAVGTANAFSASPNPASLSPSWGSHETLWIAGYGARAYTDAAPSVYPYDDTMYSSSHGSGGSNSSAASLATCSEIVDASSADPSAFTLSASRAWASFTVAVKGA